MERDDCANKLTARASAARAADAFLRGRLAEFERLAARQRSGARAGSAEAPPLSGGAEQQAANFFLLSSARRWESLGANPTARFALRAGQV